MTPLAGTPEAALSSNVMLALLAPNPPALATSDITMRFWPPGPTSIMSMSAAMAWVTPKRCRSTSVTSPVIPLTVIVEG